MRSLANTACAVIVVCPITTGQIRVRNGGTGIGSVDKLSVTGVNANVRNAACSCAGKEDDISGLQIRFGHICTMSVLISGCAVGRVTELFQYVVDKSGTVKTGWGSTAAEIAYTQILSGFREDLRTGNPASSSYGMLTGSVIFCLSFYAL